MTVEHERTFLLDLPSGDAVPWQSMVGRPHMRGPAEALARGVANTARPGVFASAESWSSTRSSAVLHLPFARTPDVSFSPPSPKEIS